MSEATTEAAKGPSASALLKELMESLEGIHETQETIHKQLTTLVYMVDEQRMNPNDLDEIASTYAENLEPINRGLADLRRVTAPVFRWRTWLVEGLAVIALLSAGAVGWGMHLWATRAEREATAFLWALQGTVSRQVGKMSPEVRQGIEAVYKQYGYALPAQGGK